jgi:Icc-related predicted phosphoesterase
VVVTHHGPHPGSLHERYAEDEAMNASFISDLSDVIAEQQPALWIHGHVHDTHDYTVGGEGGDGTRIVCNPHAYAWAPNPGFIPDLMVELPDWAPRPRCR